MKRRALWPVLLASGLGVLILCSLGIWQVQRLGEKEALIAKIDARMAAAPVTLETALARRRSGEDVDYLKVEATGRFSSIPPLRMVAVLNGGPGWELIQLLESQSGSKVLVDRGIADHAQAVSAVAGPVTVQGILRVHSGRRGLFDQDNNIAGNIWTWWDIARMYEAAGGPAPESTDLVLHLVPGSPGTEGLFAEAPKARLRNNHLSYAITWFSLAAVLALMTGLLLRQGTGKADA